MFDPVVNSFAPPAKICFLIIYVVVNYRVTCWSRRWIVLVIMADAIAEVLECCKLNIMIGFRRGYVQIWFLLPSY
jgi:hypothetical protein